MSQIWRRARAAANPVSTAATGWWCRSALRRMLTGHGPTARQRQYLRARRQAAARPPSAEQVSLMRARAQAIDDLLAQDDREA
ncbi:MAG TPA: hypothetical protein VGM79_07495 [Streptosporangiaceae bacterium]|jgi:hypothetical protein